MGCREAVCIFSAMILPLQAYTTKYIDSGSIKPLMHVMWGVFFVSYAISWPGVSFHES